LARAHRARQLFGVALALAYPASPANPPHTSLTAWVVCAFVLCLVVVGGLVLASRR
jgi:hypothetical protein